MKKVLILAAVLLLVIPNCSKKTTTNNYYYDGPEEAGALVGMVYPPESEAKVTACMGIPIASTRIDNIGYFKLSGLPAGTYSLLVQASGYCDYTSKPSITVTAGATALAETIHLVSIHDLILSVSPYDGEQNVKVSTSITIRFQRLMDTESVENAFHLTPTVGGSFSWRGYVLYDDPYYAGYELRFTPSEPLATGNTYEVTIDANASDTAGIGLSDPYTFSFTTESVGIVSTSPGHNAAWISPRTSVFIRFNADMDLNSADSAFRMVDSELSEVTGNFLWRSGMDMEFHPHSYLAVDEKYSVTIDTTAMAVGGAKLPEPYEFSFTTQPLLIESTSPQHKESWVSTSTQVWIYFNTDMDMESLNSAFEMVDSEDNNVAGDIVWSNPSYLQLVPDSPLAPDEVYTVTIAASAADMYGKTLGQAYSFWFKTRSQ
jgi:hypothetical protein